jgi:hypothetical protein
MFHRGADSRIVLKSVVQRVFECQNSWRRIVRLRGGEAWEENNS